MLHLQTVEASPGWSPLCAPPAPHEWGSLYWDPVCPCQELPCAPRAVGQELLAGQPALPAVVLRFTPGTISLSVFAALGLILSFLQGQRGLPGTEGLKGSYSKDVITYQAQESPKYSVCCSEVGQ